MARWRRVVVHTDLIRDLLSSTGKRNAFHLEAGIPATAELVEVVYHRTAAVVDLIFMSESFPDVPITLEIPTIEARFGTWTHSCVTCLAPCAACGQKETP